MLGYVTWSAKRSGRRSVWTEEQEILNLHFCAVSLLRRHRTPEAILRRRCAAAAEKLQNSGVTRAVFPQQFPWTAEFARRGVLPVEVLPLYRALTAELVRCALRSRGLSSRSAVIAVCADRMTPELQRCVTEVSIQNRYVLLDAPDRDGAFARRMCREYGVALVAERDPGRLSQADVRLLYAPRPQLEGPGAIPLYEGGALPPQELRLIGEPEARVPAHCCRSQLYAALFHCGILRPGQLALSDGEAPAAGEAGQ